MSELLTDVASPSWAYLVLFGLLVVDAFVPVIPTQLAMISGGALTVYGGLDLPLMITAGALGVLCGDLACYLLGRTGWRPAWGRARHRPADRDAGTATATVPFARSRQAARRLTRELRRPGPLVILLCRFVPGGRMAAGFRAGRARYPGHLFLLYEAVAAFGWAAYGGFLGHFGGTAVAGSGWRLAGLAALAAVLFAAAGWSLTLLAGRGRTADPADPAAY